MAELLARSPVAPTGPETVVAGWVVSGRRSDAALTLTDQTPLAKVLLRADAVDPPAALPAAGRAGRLALDGATGDVLATCVVAGEWLVLAPPGDQDLVARELEDLVAGTDGLVSLVDLTHGRALLRLTGPGAVDVLATECAVDLSDRGCPDQRALRTAVAGLAVDVVRDDVAGTPSYLLHCERSSGQYLFDTLIDAGSGRIDVDGFRTTRPPSGEGAP